LQWDDTSPGGNNTGLSLTVFKDIATNQLTLAIRGTTLSDLGDATTDLSIAANGAGYDQIAALYSWWQRASTAPDTMVVAPLAGLKVAPMGYGDRGRVIM
jgi:hypothetical protein